MVNIWKCFDSNLIKIAPKIKNLTFSKAREWKTGTSIWKLYSELLLVNTWKCSYSNLWGPLLWIRRPILFCFKISLFCLLTDFDKICTWYVKTQINNILLMNFFKNIFFCWDKCIFVKFFDISKYLSYPSIFMV